MMKGLRHYSLDGLITLYRRRFITRIEFLEELLQRGYSTQLAAAILLKADGL